MLWKKGKNIEFISLNNISLLFDIKTMITSFVINTTIIFVCVLFVYIFNSLIKSRVEHHNYFFYIETVCNLIQGITIIVYIVIVLLFLLTCSVCPIILFCEGCQYSFLFISLKCIILHLIVYLFEVEVSRSISLSEFSDAILWTITLFTTIYVC